MSIRSWLGTQITPAAKAKWGHALVVAVASGVYDGLESGQALGHVALKSIALAIAVRFSGFVMNQVGS